MIRPVEVKSEQRRSSTMADIQPLEIGVIIDHKSVHYGHVVMRTASTGKIEVMDLTSPGIDVCWTDNIPDIPVRIYQSGTRVAIIVK